MITYKHSILSDTIIQVHNRFKTERREHEILRTWEIETGTMIELIPYVNGKFEGVGLNTFDDKGSLDYINTCKMDDLHGVYVEFNY